MRNSLKCCAGYFLFICLAPCDLLSGVGIMYYSAEVLLENEEGVNHQIGTTLGGVTAYSTFIMMLLTRIPALWNLLTPTRSTARSSNSAVNTSQNIPYEELPDDSRPSSGTCESISVGLGYLAAIIVGFFLIFIQALGTKTSFRKLFGINDKEILNSLPYIAGVGSALSYFAFIFKGGALKNIKFLFRQITAPEENRLSISWKSLLVTLLVSLLGAFANSLFNFFAVKQSFKDFSPTQNLHERASDAFSGMSATAAFLMIFFSEVFDTYKLFSGRLTQTLPSTENLSAVRKIVTAIGMMTFFINKIAIAYVFCSSSKSVMRDEFNLASKLYLPIAIAAAASASFIQAVFEFTPSLNILLYKSQNSEAVVSNADAKAEDKTAGLFNRRSSGADAGGDHPEHASLISGGNSDVADAVDVAVLIGGDGRVTRTGSIQSPGTSTLKDSEVTHGL